MVAFEGAEDEQVTGEPGAGVEAARRRGRPDGDPARPARPALPHRLGVHARPARRRTRLGWRGGGRRCRSTAVRRRRRRSPPCAPRSPTTSTRVGPSLPSTPGPSARSRGSGTTPAPPAWSRAPSTRCSAFVSERGRGVEPACRSGGLGRSTASRGAAERFLRAVVSQCPDFPDSAWALALLCSCLTRNFRTPLQRKLRPRHTRSTKALQRSGFRGPRGCVGSALPTDGLTCSRPYRPARTGSSRQPVPSEPDRPVARYDSSVPRRRR